jgi:hypothetical protein
MQSCRCIHYTVNMSILCLLSMSSNIGITMSICLYCACWVWHLTLVLHCQYVYTVLVEYAIYHWYYTVNMSISYLLSMSSNIGITLSICLYCTCWVCHLTLVLHCQYVYTVLVEYAIYYWYYTVNMSILCLLSYLTLVLHCQYVYTVLVESSNIGITLSICLYCACWIIIKHWYYTVHINIGITLSMCLYCAC